MGQEYSFGGPASTVEFQVRGEKKIRQLPPEKGPRATRAGADLDHAMYQTYPMGSNDRRLDSPHATSLRQATDLSQGEPRDNDASGQPADDDAVLAAEDNPGTGSNELPVDLDKRKPINIMKELEVEQEPMFTVTTITNNAVGAHGPADSKLIIL